MKKITYAIASLVAVSVEVGAFQFDTGEDWDIRWDNQFKGNLGVRVEEQNDDVVEGPPTNL